MIQYEKHVCLALQLHCLGFPCSSEGCGGILDVIVLDKGLSLLPVVTADNENPAFLDLAHGRSRQAQNEHARDNHESLSHVAYTSASAHILSSQSQVA